MGSILSRKTIALAGTEVIYRAGGEGRPIVFLDGAEGFHRNERWLTLLAGRGRLVAPFHPGFGPTKYLKSIRSVGDLSYLYLDLLEILDLNNAVLIGASFGGWIASEMCVRNCARVTELFLLNSVGFKFGAPDLPELVDIYATDADSLRALRYADPTFAEQDYTALSEAEVTEIVNSRTAEAFYGWRPYMHNPTLHSWLHRVRRPTRVIWGENDGIAPVKYGRQLSSAISGAQFVVVHNAGHYPHLEQPEQTFKLIEPLGQHG